MLSLLLIGLLGQCDPQGPIFSCPASSAGGASAFFQFAPTNGGGMSAACACTAVTGSKGEVMTFTRASSATCMKGNTTSGIANGDLVTCSTDQPRIMAGSDGTGARGLLPEAARTNSALRSQEFENVAWQKLDLAAAGVPTVTANAATAPDGTLTADRVQYPATSAAQYSILYQAGGCPGFGASSGSVFIKGNGTSGTLDIGIDNGVGYDTTACSYVAATWTVCARANSTRAGTVTNVFIGNGSQLVAGAPTRSANDVFVWGAQCEGGAITTSYIATAGASVARARDVAFVTLPSPIDQGAGVYSAAVTASVPDAITTDWQAYVLQNAGLTLYHAMFNAAGSNLRCESFNGTVVQATTTRKGGFVNKRISCFNDGVNEQGVYDGVAMTSNAGTRVAQTAVTKLYLGCDATAGFELNGVIKQVCLDPNPTRCR